MKTLTDYLTSDGKYLERAPFASNRVRVNGQILIDLVSLLLADLGVEEFEISSGFRTPTANAAAGGSLMSAHLTGEAVDIKDVGNKIFQKISEAHDLLEYYDLFVENALHTPSWVHIQTRKVRSGNRIFHP